MMSVSKPVWVDNPAQPSRPGTATDATIRVVNQRHLVFERGDGPMQSLKMIVRNPYSLGLKSGEPIDTDEFVDRMLTACNLLLKEVRLSTVPPDRSSASIDQDKPRDSGGVVDKSRAVNEIVWEMRDDIVVSDRAEFVMHSDEKLDETRVLEVLGMIHAVHAVKSPTRTQHNIRKSLKKYSEKITANHRETVFQGLFEALEQAVNFDSHTQGAEFDKMVRQLMGDPYLSISDLRDVNNRLKHQDSDEQMSRYPDLTEVFHYVRLLRPITAAVLLRRLRETVGGSTDRPSGVE